jgi:hypothetical protein
MLGSNALDKVYQTLWTTLLVLPRHKSPSTPLSGEDKTVVVSTQDWANWTDFTAVGPEYQYRPSRACVLSTAMKPA